MLAGLCLFVGGNALITVAEKTVDSGLTSVLVATPPLWMALMEILWPRGERLMLRGWLGLLIGLGGVLVLMAPRIQTPVTSLDTNGLFLVLVSTPFCALGTFILRNMRRSSSYAVSAAYQMCLGGDGVVILALSMGRKGPNQRGQLYTPVCLCQSRDRAAGRLAAGGARRSPFGSLPVC